jgi:hypothetical protein
MAWVLRVRGPSGQSTLKLDKGGATTAEELRCATAEATGIDAGRLEVLGGGYPPRALHVSARM